MLQDFLKAAIPDPVTCLGVRLRPLSLGALLLLFRFENKFALGTPPLLIPLGDLLQGIIVCSLEFDQAQAVLADPELPLELKKWGKLIRGNFWKRGGMGARILRANEIFAKYFADGSAYPCTKAECGPARPIGSPWPALTLTALMDDLGMDFQSAMNQPLALCRWLVAANGERKGLLEVVERREVNTLQEEADAIAREVFGKNK